MYMCIYVDTVISLNKYVFEIYVYIYIYMYIYYI